MKHKLQEEMVHLGLGAKALVQPPFTGLEWYQEYAKRVIADGSEGRLVSMHRFREPWPSWEMHPRGDEVVICVGGKLILIQEIDGSEQRIELVAGEYAINPAGVWHTAEVAGEATGVFITAGEGTEHRPR